MTRRLHRALRPLRTPRASGPTPRVLRPRAWMLRAAALLSLAGVVLTLLSPLLPSSVWAETTSGSAPTPSESATSRGAQTSSDDALEASDFSKLTPSSDRAIYVGIYLHDVTSFDLKNGIFDVDFELWAKWRGDFDPDRLRVANAASITRKELSRESDGDWHSYRWEVRGTLRSEFPLHRFPFDIQALPVTLELPAADGELVPDLVSSGMAERFSITDWHYQPVFKPERSAQTYNSDLGILAHESQPTTVRRVSYQVFLERPTITVLLKLFMPVGIILLVALICLFLPPEEIDARSAIAITALLSTFAFQFTVADSLPQVTYVTLADQLFLLSYFLSSSVLIETIVVFALSRRGKDRMAGRVDRVMQIVFPLCLLVGVWSALPEPYPERPRRVDALPEIERHESSRDEVRVALIQLSHLYTFPDYYMRPMLEYPTGTFHPFLVEQKPAVDSDMMAFKAGGVLEITWKLREGLRWSDGTPVHAKDLTMFYDPESADALTEVRVPDERTAVFVWNDRLEEALKPPPAWPSHVVKKLPVAERYEYIKNNIVPTIGPYRITKFEKDALLEAEANPYFAGPPPNIGKVTLKVYEDAEACISAFLKDEVDLVGANIIAQERLAELRDQYPDRVFYEPGAFQMFLAPDLEHPGLRKLEVRKAVMMALDRQAMFEDIYGKDGVRLSHVPSLEEPPQSAIIYEHDPDQARALLDEHWPKGEPLVLYFPPFPTNDRLMSMAKEQLEAVGLEVRFEHTNKTSKLYLNGKHGGLVFHMVRASADAPIQRFWGVPRSSGYNEQFRSVAYTDDVALLEFREDHAMYPERAAQLRDQINTLYSRNLPVLPLAFAVSRGLVHPRLRNWRGNPNDPFMARTDLWYFESDAPTAPAAAPEQPEPEP